MKKKWLTGLLALACVAASGFGLAACGEYGEKGDKGDKGEQGVGIEKVEINADGNLLITFTDGSTQIVETPEQSGNGTQQAVQSLQYQRISGKDEYRVIGLGNVAELDIVIPETFNGLPVTEIGESAFNGDYDPRNSYLTSIIIPDSVTSIGNWAFSNCSSLTEIVIPDSVTSIGAWAFYYCSSLVEIVIPDSVTSIGERVFKCCSSLTEIVIPDGVASIGNMAFAYCDNLTIYCEAESQPDEWSSDWNASDCPVVWGHIEATP